MSFGRKIILVQPKKCFSKFWRPDCHESVTHLHDFTHVKYTKVVYLDLMIVYEKEANTLYPLVCFFRDRFLRVSSMEFPLQAFFNPTNTYVSSQTSLVKMQDKIICELVSMSSLQRKHRLGPS